MSKTRPVLFLAAVLAFGMLAASFLPREIFRGESAPIELDHTSLYSVAIDSPLALEIEPGTRSLRLHVVPEVGRPETYLPEDRIPFAFDVRFEQNGEELLSRQVEMDTRISISDDVPQPSSFRGTQLEGGWAGDNRGLRLAVPERIRQSGGTLRLIAGRGPYRRLLVRGFAHFDTPARPSSTRVAAREAPASYVGSSLGARDLPSELHERRVNERVARLVPRHSQPRRRATFSPYRRPWFDASRPEANALITCGPNRWVAINFEGELPLGISAEANTRVSLDGEEISVGTAPVERILRARGPRTLTLRCETQTALRLFTNEQGTRALIGERERILPVGQDRFYLLPDLRRVWFYQLNADSPVEVPSVEVEREVVVELRGKIASEEGFSAIDATIRTRDSEGRLVSELPVHLNKERSFYEYFRDGDGTSQEWRQRIRVAAGHRVEISGSPNTWVRLKAVHEDTMERTRSPWREDLVGSDKGWLFEPRELTALARVRPVDYSRLAREGRLERLVEQVRLEQLDEGEDAAAMEEARNARLRSTQASESPDQTTPPVALRDENEPAENAESNRDTESRTERARVAHWRPRYARSIRPIGDVISQRVLTQTLGRPSHYWAPITSSRRYLSGGLATYVWLRPERLGEQVRLFINGEQHLETRISSELQRFRIALPAEPSSIEVRGIGTGEAFTNANPVEGSVYRRDRFFELRRDGSLEFEFDAEPGERQSVVLQVLTENPGEQVALSYEQTGGTGLGTGSQRRIADRWRRGRFVDLQQEDPGFIKAIVPFGIASNARTRRLRLRWERDRSDDTSSRLWVRAVVVSDRPRADRNSTRVRSVLR